MEYIIAFSSDKHRMSIHEFVCGHLGLIVPCGNSSIQEGNPDPWDEKEDEH